jgi:hypothetical protein
MLTRPGLEYIGETIFVDPLRFLLCNGAFDGPNAVASQIWSSEISRDRPLVTTISKSWNTSTASLDLTVGTGQFTPTQDAVITRLALISGTSNEFGRLPTTFFGPGQFRIANTTDHDITASQLVFFANGTSATVDTIVVGPTETTFNFTMTLGETNPASSAFVFPAKGLLLGVYTPFNTGTIFFGSPISITLTGNQSAL